MVRYMRMTEATGNTYGIDPTKIVMGGHGTGAYISLGVCYFRYCNADVYS